MEKLTPFQIRYRSDPVFKEKYDKRNAAANKKYRTDMNYRQQMKKYYDDNRDLIKLRRQRQYLKKKGMTEEYINSVLPRLPEPEKKAKPEKKQVQEEVVMIPIFQFRDAPFTVTFE